MIAGSHALVVGRDDDESIVNGGGRAEALVNHEIGDPLLPEDLAVERQRGRVDGAVVQKIDEQSLAVASERRRSVSGLRIALGIEPALMDDRAPLRLAGRSIKAHDALARRFGVGGREEQLLSNDRDRTVSAAGDRRLPLHVLGVAPLGRRLLIGRSDAVAVRPAPPRPIVALHVQLLDAPRARAVTGKDRSRRDQRRTDERTTRQRRVNGTIHGEVFHNRNRVDQKHPAILVAPVGWAKRANASAGPPIAERGAESAESDAGVVREVGVG